jgi:hypothetical protein
VEIPGRVFDPTLPSSNAIPVIRIMALLLTLHLKACLIGFQSAKIS